MNKNNTLFVDDRWWFVAKEPKAQCYAIYEYSLPTLANALNFEYRTGVMYAAYINKVKHVKHLNNIVYTKVKNQKYLLCKVKINQKNYDFYFPETYRMIGKMIVQNLDEELETIEAI